jgi:hypothetical protein
MSISIHPFAKKPSFSVNNRSLLLGQSLLVSLCLAASVVIGASAFALDTPTTKQQPVSPSSNTASSAPTSSIPASMPALNMGSAKAVDLPDGEAKNIRLDIQQGRFNQESVGRLVLDAQNIDFRKGALASLKADILDGYFATLPVDKLSLQTQGFSFDTFELLNKQRFILNNPIEAKVSMMLSEKGLNKFFADPKTLERLEKAVSQKTGNLIQVTFSNPTLKLMSQNRVQFGLNVGLGNALSTPVEMLGLLALEKGNLALTQMQMSTNGVALPFDLATLLQKKLNDLMSFEKLGKNNFVIEAQKMKVTNTAIALDGRASLNRLEFGKR